MFRNKKAYLSNLCLVRLLVKYYPATGGVDSYTQTMCMSGEEVELKSVTLRH